MATDRVESRWARGAVLLIAPAVLAALGSWGLVRHGAYGDDESATRWAATLPIHALFRLLSHIDAVHGLYYLGMHAWLVLGRGPVALRMPSLLAAIAAAGVVTALGRRLSGSTAVGVIAGLLYAVSPFVMFYAQTARSYAIVSLLVAIETLVLVHALEADSDEADPHGLRWWVAYGGLVGLVGWLNEMSLLVLAAHAVTVVATRNPQRARMRWLVASIVGMVIVLPLFIISFHEHSAVSWITAPSAHAVYTLIRDYFGPRPIVMVLTLACAAAAVVPRRAALEARSEGGLREAWRNRGPVGVTSVALPLVVVPPALLVLESDIGQPIYTDRYLLYGVIGAVLLVAQGAHRIGRKLFDSRVPAGALATGLVVVLAVTLIQIPTYQHIRKPNSRLRNFGLAAQFIERHALPGDGALYFGPFFRYAEEGYPADFRDVQDIGVAKTPLQSGTFRGIDSPFSVAAPRILATPRIWVIGLGPFAPLPIPLLDQERNLLIKYFDIAKTKQFHGLIVTLWIRRPPPAHTPKNKAGRVAASHAARRRS